jgi:hypothetical protein
MRRFVIAERVSQVAFYCCGALLFCTLVYYVLFPLRGTTLETQSTMGAVGTVTRTVQPQIAPAAHTVGIILERSAVVTDEAAKASVAQKSYWTQLSQHTVDMIGDTQDAVKSYGALAETARGQLPETLQRANAALGSLNTTLLTVNTQVGGIGPFFSSATQFTNDADASLKNPELIASLANFRRISGAWAGMSEDAQKKFHSIIDPAKPSHFGMIMDGVRVAGPVGELVYDLTNIHH